MNQVETEGEIAVDVGKLVRQLWKKAWLIALAALICASVWFGYTKLCITPLYRARTTMYVNNQNAAELPQNSISSGDLTAAENLVETYTVFLQSRSTLGEVTAQLGLGYSYEQMKRMVRAVGIRDTSAFEVVVTGTDPEEAALIANTIGKVLPGKIADYIPGSSVKVVDPAVVPEQPFAPNTAQNTALGALTGILLSCGILIVRILTDRKIHSAEELTQIGGIAVLAVIPDLMRAEDFSRYGKETDAAGMHPHKGSDRP